MIYFQTQNPTLGKFGRALEWKMLVFLWQFGTGHLVCIWPFGSFVIIWCIFPRFGTLYLEKSGNPAANNKAFVCGTF
jgi:hypothetical protein